MEDSTTAIKEHLEQLQTDVTSANCDITTVIVALQEPLVFFNPSDASTWSGPQPTLILQMYFINRLYPRYLDFLLDTVVVDWLHALTEKQIKALFDVHFVPPAGLPYRSTMVIISLKILVTRLTRPQQGHSLVLHTVLRLLKSLVASINVLELYDGILGDTNLVQRNEWKDFVDVLCSVPGRVANAIGIEESEKGQKQNIVEILRERPFFSKISKDIEISITELSKRNDIKESAMASYAFSEMIAKLCRLGHARTVTTSIFPTLTNHLSHPPTSYYLDIWHSIVSTLPIHALEAFLSAFLMAIPLEVAVDTAADAQQRCIQRATRTVRALVGSVTGNVAYLFKHKLLVGGKVYRLGVLRVLICLLSGFPDQIDDMPLLREAIKALLAAWSDPTFVKHGAWANQKYITSAILLSFGYLPKDYLGSFEIMEDIMRGVQHWISSTIPGARKLAMVAAEELSKATDVTGNILNFDMDEDAEIRELRALVQMRDGLADLNDEDAHAEVIDGNQAEIDTTTPIIVTEKEDPEGSVAVTQAHESLIYDEDDPDAPVRRTYEGDDDEQDGDSDNTSDDSLEPYPMEEEEAQDTGPGNFNRGKKITVPVYVRDLIAYLRASEDPDRIEAGLKGAEELIRRKAGVGLEVQESAIDLAHALLNLQDTFESDEFDVRRQRAVNALVSACPRVVVPFIVEQLYDKNYNIGQRLVMLTGVAVGARELSGFEEPSAKTLPTSSTIDSVAHDIRQLSLAARESENKTPFEIIENPMKTRRFSRKSEVEARRAKPKANRYASLAGRIFFFPLIGVWFDARRGDGGFDVLMDPVLLEKFLMTLGILVYCAVNTLDTKAMVREFWEFLLALRFHDNPAILSAILFGVMVTIDVIDGRDLVEMFAREIIETQEWAHGIFKTNGDTKVQMMCANVLVRLTEITNEYQRLLLQDLLPVA